MKITMTLCAAALGTLACAGSLQAHHSGSMYDTSPVWIEGTVIRFESIDPHTITVLEATSEDGQVRRWAVEGPGRSQLDRMRIGMDVPKVGDVIEFCAFPYKSAAELSRLFPGVDFSVRRAPPDTDATLAGHVMVMPDGDMRLWEPHGLTSACIRGSDDQ